jgi:diguanylate cyclase (GGDEF)-like protein/PAS domain S-box-containing protein
MIERGGVVIARNAMARRMTGYVAVLDELPRVTDVLLGAFELEEPAARVRFECAVARRHGPPMPVHGVAQRMTHDGEECRLLIMMERREGFGAEGDREGSLVEDVLDAMPEASVITHGSRILHVNREFRRLFGYAAAECVGRELTDLVVPEGLLHEREMIQHTLRKEGRVAMETRRRTRFGEDVDVYLLIAKVRLGRRAMGTLVTYRDIRAQKQEEARLKHSARHDVLTGLANRALFLEEVALTLGRLRRRPDRSFAVIFMDLDGFKQVNDTLGHAAGDALLLVVAGRLKRCLRPQDTVARFGGDEFALLLAESGTALEVQSVAARIQTAIQQEIELCGTGDPILARVSASLGIAMAVPAHESAEEIMALADAAMYSAKAAGGGRHVVYLGDGSEIAKDRTGENMHQC